MKCDDRFRARVATLLAVGVAGVSLAACSSSNSGFSDPIEDAIGDPLVMMGLRVDPNKEEIEYGPRSPLVMPAPAQTQDLPPPVARTESFGAQWPDDPDERAKREAEAMRQAAREEKVRDVEYASTSMTPDELDEWGRMHGRTNGAGITLGPRGREQNKTVNPRELLDRRADPNELRSEPPRTSLNEPPPGYRTPAPPVDGEAPVEQKKSLFQKLFGRS